jgi:ribosomal protein S18 acetylase RimI-like enzyme
VESRGLSEKATRTVDIALATGEDAAGIIEKNWRMANETEGKDLPRDRLDRGVRLLLADKSKGFYIVAKVGPEPKWTESTQWTKSREVHGVPLARSEAVGQLMVTFEWSDWRAGTFWWIQSVYVDAPFRRTGIYRALYEHVLGLAKADSGVCGVRLYVERHNTVAQQTYADLGMTRAAYEMFEVDFTS